MCNRAYARRSIIDFLDSDNDLLFLRGTFQNEKHSLVLDIISQDFTRNNEVLFRINHMANRDQFAVTLNGYTFRRNGRYYEQNNKRIYIDTINPVTWVNTPNNVELAIVYPVDSLISGQNERQVDNCIDDIENRATKIIYITWTDNVNFRAIYRRFPLEICFDAEEERPEYHQTMLDYYENLRLGRLL